MSGDYTDQIIQWILEQSAAGQPQPIPEYDLDPEDVVQDRARRMNLYQDTLSNQADMSVAAMAGPSAYSPGAFESTSTYTPIEQPGTQQLRAYAARGNTPEGIIAQGILGGSTAQAEIAKLQAAYTEALANGTLEGNPILAQIPMGPPSDYDGTILPDWEGLQRRMGDVEEAYFTEAQGGSTGALYDPYTGELVSGGNRRTVLDENGLPVLADVETSPSEAAQWYADQGLSLPTDQFTAADLMDPQQAQYMGAIGGLNDAWLNALRDWQLQTVALPPPDAGKAGLVSAQTAQYGKGQQAAALPPFVQDPVTQQTGAPQSWWQQQGIAPPEQNVADIVNQIRAEQTRFGYPGTVDNQQALIDAAAAQGNDVSDLLPVDGGGGGIGGGGQLGYQASPIQSILSNVPTGTQPSPPAPGTVDWNTAIPNGPQPGGQQPASTQALLQQLLSGGNQMALTPSPQPIGVSPQPASTQALLQQLLGGGNRMALTPGGGLGQNSPYNQPGAMGPPMPVPNTSACTGPEPSEMAGQAQQPTLDQMISIMGQRPPRENMHDVTGDQQVRIGKTGGKPVKTPRAAATPARYPKPGPRNTPESRAAEAEAVAALNRASRARHAAGIDTEEYGRALAMARFLRGSGITPLSTQQAARRAASGPYGV